MLCMKVDRFYETNMFLVACQRKSFVKKYFQLFPVHKTIVCQQNFCLLKTVMDKHTHGEN